MKPEQIRAIIYKTTILNGTETENKLRDKAVEALRVLLEEVERGER